MELLIVRHGIAQARGAAGVASDFERPLTADGRSRTRQAAEGLRALGYKPDRIGTSPLRRALETADILAQVLCPEVAVEQCGFLGEGADTEDVARWLKESREQTVLVVGHMPDVADIASGFLSRRSLLDMTFKKAAVCCVSFQERPAPGEGRLEWMLQPRHLRALADATEA